MNCFKQLEYVLEVAKNQSITKAAKKLYITYPTLRDSINSLENELGFSIFFRSNRGVTLTTSGKKFLDDVERILKIASMWESDLAEMQNIEDEYSTIHISISLSIADYIFKQVLLKFVLQHPNISLNLDYCSSPTMLSEAKDKTVPEILIVGAVDDKISDLLHYAEIHDYDIETLMTPPAGVIVSSKHPLTKKEAVSLKDLKQYDIAVLNSSGEDDVMRLISSYARQIVFVTNNRNDILELISNSDIVSWLPYFSVSDSPLVEDKKLVFLPIESLPTTSYYIIYPCHNKLRTDVKHAVTYIKAFYQKEHLV
ncbi:MAG: LysR family transcriptional regulator [Peptococcaceae bacterium]|nr:LysR family transcriptional regulator [Peptococcaceae bacterium]